MIDRIKTATRKVDLSGINVSSTGKMVGQQALNAMNTTGINKNDLKINLELQRDARITQQEKDAIQEAIKVLNAATDDADAKIKLAAMP
jgi:hypothetical protein